MMMWWSNWADIVTATEEEAAEAYDIAAIKFRGANAVTNFEMNRYDVEAIMKSALPVGGAAKRLKLSLESEQKVGVSSSQQQNPPCGSINFSAIHQPVASIPCGIPFDSSTAYYHHNLFQHFHPTNYFIEALEGFVWILILYTSKNDFWNKASCYNI